MQLLQRLRSLVNASKDSEKPEATPRDTPDIDDKQLEQLQQALKKLQDQLPPGMKAPDLDSIPEEQLDDASSNPAVQQQLKKMLEQFSRDGLLPQNDNGNPDSAMPPMPRKRGESSVRPDSQQQSERNRELSRQPSISEKSIDEFAPTEPDSSKRILRRSDRATPIEPPRRSRTTDVGTGRGLSACGKAISEFLRLRLRVGGSAKRESSRARPGVRCHQRDSLPSVSEFLKDQFRQGFPVPNTDDTRNRSKV